MGTTFSFVRNCRTVVQSGRATLPSHRINDSAGCAASFPAVHVVIFLDFGHPDRCVVGSCHFNSHFLLRLKNVYKKTLRIK